MIMLCYVAMRLCDGLRLPTQNQFPFPQGQLAMRNSTSTSKRFLSRLLVEPGLDAVQ